MLTFISAGESVGKYDALFKIPLLLITLDFQS